MNQKTKATGHRAGYLIVQWSNNWDPSLMDLLERVPGFVVGRRVAIASCDSGKYAPSAAELASGWEVVDRIAISPQVASASTLPMPGFDEWYVYDERPNAYAYKAFVNQFGFSPLAVEDPKVTEFWAQVDATRPLHVLGAGTPFMFVVTRDADLFGQANAIW
jgi:hypothetical protein